MSLKSYTPFAAMLALALFVAISPADPSRAQLTRPGELPALDAETRSAIVDSITAAIDSIYVLLEPAENIVAGLRSNLADGKYDDFVDPSAFADRLYEDAQEINHDGHFRIFAMPPRDPEVVAANREEDPADIERRRRMTRARNYGFSKAEILPGGVGYLRFDQFSRGDDAYAAASAAMNFLANSNAVILDVRQNGGGAAAMIRYLCGYLFRERTHLINWDVRAEGVTEQSYSSDYVPGKRIVDQPVYILTSGQTFSAAEEFSFDLKNHERAILVGETTGGGGHTVAGYAFDFEGFRIGIRLPYGRAYNPETNEGWEGIGVTPHIEVPAAQALDAAHADALQKLIEAEEDEGFRASLQWALTDIESRKNPMEISLAQMQELVGQYGPRRVYLEDGTLFYQRDQGQAHPLTPMGENLFKVGDLGFFRLSFERDDQGSVVRIVGNYDDGRTDGNDRDGV